MSLHFCISGPEVSGVVHDICNSLPNCNLMPGDKVIMFPEDDLVLDGCQEYIAISDTENIVQLPSNIPLEVAAMLPGAALQAYNAVLKAKPHIEKLQKVKGRLICFNMAPELIAIR